MQAVQSPIIPVVGELIRNCPGTISLGQGVVYYGPPPEAYEYCTYNDVQQFSPGAKLAASNAYAQSSGHTISLYSLSKAYGFKLSKH
jgi:hypothetical protein